MNKNSIEDGQPEQVTVNEQKADNLTSAQVSANAVLSDGWISVNDRLPNDFDEQGQTQPYLVYIDNPFFKNGNYHVSYFEKSSFGEQYNHWCGIEPNVHHGTTYPNVTHWILLPKRP